MWQSRGRSESTFEERLDYDIMYYKNRTLRQDMKILIQTFFKLVKKEGAV